MRGLSEWPKSSANPRTSQVHHDQNAGADSLMGVRLFTFFIYLHEPEGGGGTHFPNLNITINPKKGSALVWPNVME